MRLKLYHGRLSEDSGPTDTEGSVVDDWGFEGPTLHELLAVDFTYGNKMYVFKTAASYSRALLKTGWPPGVIPNSLLMNYSEDADLVRTFNRERNRDEYFGDYLIEDDNDERTQEPAHRDVSVTGGDVPAGNEPGGEGAGSGCASSGTDPRPAADAERPTVPEERDRAEQAHQGVLNPSFKYADQIDLACFLEGAHKVLRENRYNEYPGGEGYMGFIDDCLRHFHHLDVEPPEDGYTSCFAYDVAERFGEEIASRLYQDGNVSDYDAGLIAAELIAEITPDEVDEMVVPDDSGIYTLQLIDARVPKHKVAEFWLFGSRREYEKACAYLQHKGVKHIRNAKDTITDADELAVCLTEAGITKSETT